MDNITHTLAGLLVAEAALELRRRRGETVHPRWRSAALLASLAANNLPDLDFVYIDITGGKLGYLLHHRGHTHTFAAALPLALLVLGLVLGWARWRDHSFDRLDWRWLGGLCLFGPLLHVGMDFANNYGVHPFWPIYDGWVYGDSWFILEPTFWISIAVPLAFAAQTRIGQGALALLALGIVVLGWVVALVPWWISAAVTGQALLLFALAWRSSHRGRVIAAAASFAICGMIFAAVGRLARSSLAEHAMRPVDAVVTPMPGNPFCWGALLVEADDDSYRVSVGVLAPFPSLVTPAQCPRRMGEASTAPLEPVTRASPEIRWFGRFEAPLSQLQGLAQDDCRAAAFLRYSRVPFWKPGIIGDLRYDRDGELGFAEIELSEGACPRFVPPWRPPRAELLR